MCRFFSCTDVSLEEAGPTEALANLWPLQALRQEAVRFPRLCDADDFTLTLAPLAVFGKRTLHTMKPTLSVHVALRLYCCCPWLAFSLASFMS
jgi:hypothetical protein